jgi:hypothetical protein
VSTDRRSGLRERSGAGWLGAVIEAPVIGVVGGRGGVGASGFAATLAAIAARRYGRCALVDLDPPSGGLDVLLGIEDVGGARWSGLRLAGGHLDSDVLFDGLPAWHDVRVLAADNAVEPAEEAVAQVVEVARRGAPVVLDLGRWPCPSREVAVSRCVMVVLVVRPDVAGVTGARCVAASVDAPLGVLVRGSRSSTRLVPELVGAQLLGRLPRRRSARRERAVAAGVLDAVLR